VTRCGALLAIALAGCAATLTAGEAKVVRAHPLASYQIHEECFKLEEGDRVEFRFESTEPVDFNLHYLEGHAVVMPISREKSSEHGGVYLAPLAQDYCLMWEAGAAGALIDYRILIKPAAGS
jgi:hypothetical protein